MASVLKGLKNGRSILEVNDGILLEIDEDTRTRLQGEILCIYKDILEACNKYSICPFLIGGSALGAVRHQGFIPWDDDIDIGMTRNDYMRFINIFDKELGEKYILNAPNVSSKPKARFTKIYKKGTVCREVTDLASSINGLFIDIFIIENIPRNIIIRKMKGAYCNILEFISTQVYLYENDNPSIKALYSRMGEDNYKSRIRIGKFFSYRRSEKWFNSLDKAVQHKKITGLYGIVTGRKHYFGEIFEENVFFPCQKLVFEDIKAPVFNDMDKYLQNLYHNYMEIPPEDKRERHYLVELKF